MAKNKTKQNIVLLILLSLCGLESKIQNNNNNNKKKLHQIHQKKSKTNCNCLHMLARVTTTTNNTWVFSTLLTALAFVTSVCAAKTKYLHTQDKYCFFSWHPLITTAVKVDLTNYNKMLQSSNQYLRPDYMVAPTAVSKYVIFLFFFIFNLKSFLL